MCLKELSKVWSQKELKMNQMTINYDKEVVLPKRSTN